MRLLLAVVLIVLAAASALAQMGQVPAFVGAGGCSQSLVFSAPCNSQYFPVVF